MNIKKIDKLNYYGLTIFKYETEFGYQYYQLSNSLDVELNKLGINDFDALEVVNADKGATTECQFGRHVIPHLTPHTKDIKLFQKTNSYTPWDIPVDYKNLHNIYFRNYLWSNQAFEAEGKWGVCDNTGKLLMRPEYDSCEIIKGLNSKHEGIIVCKNGKKAFVSNLLSLSSIEWYDDMERAFHSSDMMITHIEGKVGLVCVDGRTMVSCDADEIFKNDQGSFPYRKDGKWGFVFFSRELMDYVATTDLFDDFRGWHEFQVLKGKKWGYINPYGNFVTRKRERAENFWLCGPYRDLAQTWNGVKPFDGDFPELDIPADRTLMASSETDARIKKYTKYQESLTPRDSKEFVFLYEKLRNYERAINWSPGVFEKDGKFGVMDNDGKILLPAKYDEIKERPSGRMSHYTPAIVRQGQHWGLRSLFGGHAILLQSNYDDIIYKGIMTGYEIVLDGKHGLVDVNGKMLIPCRMDFWVEKSEWLLFVMVMDNKIGFYNHYGLYIEPEYEKFIYVYNKLFCKHEECYEYWELSTSSQTPTCYPLTDKDLMEEVASKGVRVSDVYNWYNEGQTRPFDKGDNILPSFVKVISDEEMNKIKKGDINK